MPSLTLQEFLDNPGLARRVPLGDVWPLSTLLVFAYQQRGLMVGVQPRVPTVDAPAPPAKVVR